MMCAFLVPARAVALFDGRRSCVVFCFSQPSCCLRFGCLPECGLGRLAVGEALHGLTTEDCSRAAPGVAPATAPPGGQARRGYEVIACLWLWLRCSCYVIVKSMVKVVIGASPCPRKRVIHITRSKPENRRTFCSMAR